MKQVLQKMQRIVAGSFFALAFCFSVGTATAQVDVVASAGTPSASYTTLKNTFDAINAGTHQGTITISISGDVVETASAVINASGTGSSSFTSISIKPSGGAVRTISGSLAAPLIDFNGADNVTIDGLNTSGNGLTINNTSALATAGTSTIRFVNDATSNLITNCTVLGSSTGAASQNAGTASAVTATILFGGSTGTTGNDNNTISNSTIADGTTLPTVAIGSAGQSTALSNDNIVISGNNIANFYGTSGANGIDVASNSSTWTISGNKFYQTASRTGLTSGSYLECVYVNTASGSGYTIQNNIIGYANSTGTGMLTNSGGRFVGIDLAAVAATPVSNIQGNTINGINWTTASGAATAGSSPFSGIIVKAGGVNIGSTLGNTIGSTSSIGSATSNIFITSTTSGSGIYGIYVNSSNGGTISNNSIGGITATGAVGIGFTFVGINTAGTGNYIVNSNTVGGSVSDCINLGVAAGTAAITAYGIQTNGTGNITVGASGVGNTINNITINSSGSNTVYSIYNSGAVTGTNSIAYNTINNTAFTTTSTTSSTIYTAIYSSSAASTSTFNITNNTIGANAMNYTAAGNSTNEFRGIYQSGTPLNGTIASNTMNSLSLKTIGNIYGIYNSYSAPANGTKIVQNNTITGLARTISTSNTSTFYGYYDFGSSPTSSSHTISGNAFSNIAVNSTGSGTAAGFYTADYSSSNPSMMFFNNSVTGLTHAGSGTLYAMYINGLGGTAGTPNEVYNNTVSGINTASSSVTQTGITVSSTSLYVNVHDNTVQNNVSTNASSQFIGIFAVGTSNLNKFYNNTIVNNTSAVAATIVGIYVNGGTQMDFYENTINSMSSAGSVLGFFVNAGTLVNIYRHQLIGATNKSIYGLTSSGATTFADGIRVVAGTTVNVYKNSVYGISNSNASTTATASLVNGITISGSTSANVYNNLISQLTAPSAGVVDAVRGISVTSTTTSATYRVYDNTIYLNATSTGTNFGTSGLYHTVNATTTTAALDLRNNIVINESTPNGTGISTAYRRSGSATLGNYASTSNRNMLYGGAASASRLIMYDGTTSYQTMTAFQTAVLPREANSFSGEATFAGSGYGTAGNFFISLTPTSSDFLRPVAGITTQIESGGATITTPAITDDYTGATRTSTPDVGAYEFAGITPTPVITLNSVTPPTTSQCTAAARLVSVNITTASGTIVNATIGYTVNGVPQTNIVMTNTTGTTWTCTIPASSPVNATIAWGVAAVNSLGINGSYVGTTYSDEPQTGVVATATNSASPICFGSTSTLTASASKAGIVTLGSGSTVSTGSAAQTPFYGGYGGVKTQYIIRASELTAAGLVPGNINSLGLTVVSPAGSALNGFAINVEQTALTVLTGNIEVVNNQVYSTATYTPVVGVNTFNFISPVNWDGTSNLIISFCWSNNNTSNTVTNVLISTTSFVSGNARYVDSHTSAEVCSYTGSATPSGWNGTSTTISSRPIFLLSGSITAPISSISWSDGTTTVGTTNPLTVTPAATYTYTPTVQFSGCPIASSPTTTVTVTPLPTAPTATNSAQCGDQVPTASVSSTTGLPTPTFKWYMASSGGTASQTSTSTTYGLSIATTTTFYVSELNTTTGCESPRTAVTVNVSTPDQIAVVASPTSICLGASVTLTASNTSGTPFQSYTYSFQSATTGSGAVTSVSGNPVTITPSAAGTFVYTASGVDGGCTATNTVSVIVNALPVISSATATPTTVCSNNPIALQAQSVVVAAGGTAIVGSGALSGSSSYYTPFYHLFGGVKDQFIIRASELTAAGLSAGNITALGLNITTVGTTYAGFTVHIGNTAGTDLSAGLVPLAGLTQVYSNATLTLTASSLNTFTFATPFPWDGVSNIVVQTSWSNNNSGGTDSGVLYDNTAYVSNAYFRADNNTPAAILAATTATSTSSARPKMTFTGFASTNVAPSLNWSWTPGGFNTATATTSINNTTGSAITQSYTVTATNSTTGCSNTATTAAVTINPATVAPTAVNSTQCGQGVPTAQVTGSGTPGNTFAWYTVSTGGTAIAGETGSTLSTYSINTTTTFYVAESNGTCQSARVPVTATVTAPPTISVSGTTTICNGSSTALTASSSNDPNYTYTWSGGLGTGATVSAAPSTNTTYTVTATDASGGANNGCMTSTTYSITVNPVPLSFPITPATATICEGGIQQLTSGPSVAAGTAILGTGTTAPGTTSFPNPLSAFYGGTKHQMLFTAAELSAQGMVTGSKINSVAFDLNAFLGNACTNFTIRMGNTASTALTGFVTGTSTVYGPTTFTPSATGIVTFTLTTPYTWDGTSNIIVETVHNAGNSGNGSGTRTNTTTTAANTVFYGSSDNVAGGIAGFDALTTWGTSGASSSRPNMRFAFTNILPTWTPLSSLYTNAGATTAYTGTITNSVYAKPVTTTSYVATYTGSNGCTSQRTATITVNHPTTSTLTQSACSSYTLNGTNYNASGTYVQHLTNAAGCDSAITLNLTIYQPTTSTLTQTACSSYTLNGTSYNTSGTYTQILTGANSHGCDSTITLNLTINQPTTSTMSVTACNSYTLNGSNYTSTGVYTQTLAGANSVGCDSIITLNLTINQPTTSTIGVTACSSYTLNGSSYTSSGTYTQHLTNAAGCDSAITLNLIINQPTTATVNGTGCNSFTYNGTVYNMSGTYTQILNNAVGCDSVVTVNVSLTNSFSTINATACSSYTLNGIPYFASGTYTQVLAGGNASGCDSTITLNLIINQPTTSTISIAACESYTWAQNNATYTVSGMYNDTINNAAGCDSIITLNLTINQPTASTISITACGTYTWAQNNATYTTSGMYNDTINNAAGCDSIITLNLTINQPTANNITAVNCSSFTLNGSTYTASGTYIQHLTNAAGCDSAITLSLTITQPTTSTTTITQCGGTYTWTNNVTYNTSGTYIQSLYNAAGCDSTATLVLTINALPVATATDNGNATITASSGNSYQWINCTTGAAIAGATAQTFAPSANGNYAVVISNASGCTDTSACVTINNVGIMENTSVSIAVFPNPTHNEVTVTMDASSATIEVVDAQGKLLQTTQVISGGKVDLSTYETGVYFLRITTEYGSTLERIVKN